MPESSMKYRMMTVIDERTPELCRVAFDTIVDVLAANFPVHETDPPCRCYTRPLAEKPCPFCKSRSLSFLTGEKTGATRVQCNECGAIGPDNGDDLRQAAAGWNWCVDVQDLKSDHEDELRHALGND